MQDDHGSQAAGQAPEGAGPCAALLQRLCLHAGIGLATLDLVTQRLLDFNAALSQITGYAPEELRARTLSELTDPRDREADAAALARLRSGDADSVVRDKRCRHRDGHVVWVRATTILVDAGRACALIERTSELRETQDALRRSERLYRTLSANMPESAVFLFDTDLRYVLADGPALAAAGLRGADLEGRTLWQSCAPELAQDHEPNLRRALAGQVFSAEHAWAGRHYFSTGMPVHDDAGRVNGVLVISHDISERRRAELALEAEALRRRMFVEQSHDGIFVLDAEGRLCESNAAYAGNLGYTREEMLALHVWDWDVRWTREELMAMVRAADEQGCQFETRHRRKDGSCYDAEITCNLALVDGRRLLFCVCRDISERKRSEMRLRESEERLRMAERIGRVGSWDWDMTSGEITFSRVYCEILGLPARARWSMDRLESRVHPEDRDWITGEIAALRAEGGGWKGAFRVIHPQRGVLWLSVVGEVIGRDAEGRPLRMLGIATDITERRLAEEALREADRRKDAFLAVLAHELRNPLAPMKHAAEALEALGGGDAAGRESRQIIRRQLAHLSRLVDDLLDVSRIARGKIRLAAQRLDLAALVRQVADDHRAGLAAAGIGLRVALPEAPPWVCGDADRIAQIVGNLLNNAEKFTDAGGMVELALRREGGQALIAVRDSGIGMDAATLSCIFEPFSQAERSLARARGGLGLGLALVRGLAELHGGEAHAASAGSGRGSTFSVRLPLTEQTEEEAVRPPAAGNARGIRRRVLVVEDNEDAAASLRLLLELDGHEARVAHDGESGIAAALADPPDVLICDIGLPGIDGYSLARTLRADPRLRSACLVAYTGYGQPEDVRRAHDAGFDHHITKPIEIERLHDILAHPGHG